MTRLENAIGTVSDQDRPRRDRWLNRYEDPFAVIQIGGRISKFGHSFNRGRSEEREPIA